MLFVSIFALEKFQITPSKNHIYYSENLKGQLNGGVVLDSSKNDRRDHFPKCYNKANLDIQRNVIPFQNKWSSHHATHVRYCYKWVKLLFYYPTNTPHTTPHSLPQTIYCGTIQTILPTITMTMPTHYTIFNPSTTLPNQQYYQRNRKWEKYNIDVRGHSNSMGITEQHHYYSRLRDFIQYYYIVLNT